MTNRLLFNPLLPSVSLRSIVWIHDNLIYNLRQKAQIHKIFEGELSSDSCKVQICYFKAFTKLGLKGLKPIYGGNEFSKSLPRTGTWCSEEDQCKCSANQGTTFQAGPRVYAPFVLLWPITRGPK